MASESPKVSIKLLIDKERNGVILAEVGYDFVAILRSLLTFPLGNIARLAAKHQSLQPGCLENLYNSVKNLDPKSFRTDACKRMLLSPRSVHQGTSENLKLNMDVEEPTKYFVCPDLSCTHRPVSVLSYYSKTIRCGCGTIMSKEINDGKKNERDAIKDESEGVLYNVESMFFITDDLRVMQGWPGDLVNFLLSLGVKNVSQTEEKVLKIGSEEMSNLLSHSIVSSTTLTDVFLRKQGTLGSAPMLDEQFILAAPSGKTSLNIIQRKSDSKILYAEASEDFVDLLFSFLTIPLQSALELLGGEGNMTVGSISNLLKDLDTIFSITKPRNSEKGILPPFFSCPNEFPSIRSQDPPLISGHDGSRLVHLDPKSPKRNSTNSSGYVKKNSLFVVTDDIVVESLSSVSTISLLSEMGTPLDDVEQHVISIGNVEALGLLRSCLCSSSALSAALSDHVKLPKQEPNQHDILVAMSRIWDCYPPIFKMFQ